MEETHDPRDLYSSMPYIRSGSTHGRGIVAVMSSVDLIARRQSRMPAVNPLTKVLKRLYSLDEAATYLGRSTWSVRRLIWAGDLPSVRARGRVHVDLRDMEAFIESNKVREDAA